MKTKTIPAGAFKARCLAIMDEVASKRESVIITKRGKPVAKLVPVEKEKDDIFGFFKGKGKIESREISSLPSSVPKSGAICIDPARHSCGHLAGSRSSTHFYKGTEGNSGSALEGAGVGGVEHDAS